MPSVNFTVKWPNGVHEQYYSPSTVIYDYLTEGKRYVAAQFLKQAENGLNAASRESEHATVLLVAQQWIVWPPLNGKLKFLLYKQMNKSKLLK